MSDQIDNVNSLLYDFFLEKNLFYIIPQSQYNVENLNELDNERTLLYKYLTYSGDGKTIGPLKSMYLIHPPEMRSYGHLEYLQSILVVYVGNVILFLIQHKKYEALKLSDKINNIKKYLPGLTKEDILMYYLDTYIKSRQGEDNIDDDVKNELLANSRKIMKIKKDDLVNIVQFSQLKEKLDDWLRENSIQLDDDEKVAKRVIDMQEDLLDINPVEEEVYADSIKISKITQTCNIQELHINLTTYNSTSGRSSIQELGIDIFDSAKVSRLIPYIKYNSFDRSYYKLYKDDGYGNIPNYDNIVPSIGETSKNDVIYMKIKTDPKYQLSTQGSYNLSSLDLVKNKIIFSTVLDPRILDHNDDTIAELIETNLNVKLGNRYDIKTSGSFRIYNVGYDELSFVYYITNNDILSTYLYINELSKGYPFKKRLKYHYRAGSDYYNEDEISDIDNEGYTKASITFSIFPGKTNTEVFLPDPDLSLESEIVIPSDFDYIDIIVDRAESRDILKHFHMIMLRLISLYKKDRNNILDIHDSLGVNDFNSFVSSEGNVSIKSKSRPLQIKGKYIPTNVIPGSLIPTSNWESIDKLDLMKERTDFATFVTNGYSRKVQKQVQPLTLLDEEVDAWKKTRKILTFPRIGDTKMGNHTEIDNSWNFVCPSEKYPVIGLLKVDLKEQVTINGITKSYDEWFPLVPICYLSNSVKGEYTDRYSNGESIQSILESMDETKPRSSNYESITSKTVSSGYAEIPKELNSITQILKSVNPDYTFKRLGTFKSPNSFIHSVLNALTKDTNYTGIPDLINLSEYRSGTKEYKEMLVKNMRMKIADPEQGYIYPSLLRQEMYDLSENEIISRITDVDLFFDPSLFYRIIEQLFEVNIYVFTSGTKKKLQGSLEIPRFREFYSKPKLSYNKTIIIYKNFGSESGVLQYPHCELIVSKITSSKNIYEYIFDTKMNDLLYDLTNITSMSFTWNISNWTNEPITRTNTYSLTDYLSTFKSLGYPSKQIIDNYGKLRGLLYATSDNNENLVIMTIPSQPINVPSINKDDPELKNVPSIDTILSIFSGNEATGYTKNVTSQDDSNQYVDGIWVKMYDITYAIYLPFLPLSFDHFITIIDPSNNNNSLMIEQGPPNPISAGKTSIISRTKSLRKTLDIIMQMIIWTFNIWLKQVTFQSSQSRDFDYPSLFIEEFFIINPSLSISQSVYQPSLNVTDSNEIYYMQNLDRLLPYFDDVNMVLDYISQIIPNLVINGKFNLYSDKFWRGLSYFIRQYYNVNKGLDLVIPKEIYRFYDSESDFIQEENTAIFLKEVDMKSWIQTIKRSDQGFISIMTQLDIGFENLTEPYIYKSPDQDGNIYLIQNVSGGDKTLALNVAYQWYTNRINPGYLSNKDGLESFTQVNTYPAYYIYYISNDNQPFAESDFTGGATRFLQILAYTPNKFAAMLPIL